MQYLTPEMQWIFLIVAALMEIGWVISLKYSDGFTKIVPLIFYGFFGFTGAFFFSNSLKSLPMGLAYAIWMGIAIIGTTIAEYIIYGKGVNTMKIFFILLILVGIAGLKFFSGESAK